MIRGRSGPSFAPDGRHVSALTGGLLALILPVLAGVPTVQAVLEGDRAVLDGATAPIASGVLFLVAAPTVWVVGLFDLAPGVTVALAALTSLPLWFAAGVWIADRSRTWSRWWGRYLGLALTWAVGFLLLVAAHRHVHRVGRTERRGGRG